MSQAELTPDAFVRALARELKRWSSGAARPNVQWCKSSHRTHVLKGDAGRSGLGLNPDPVLGRVLAQFDYRREREAHTWNRVHFHERHKLDVVAVESEANWADDCWQGRYRTTLALEVENDLQEFELTMRGLLDVRAALHCGLFFAGEPLARGLDGLEVGVSHRKDRGGVRIPLEEWTPPWARADRWRVPPLGDEKLLAVFLSWSEPKLLGARCYEPGMARPCVDLPITTEEVAGA